MQIKGKNWKRGLNIPDDKYKIISSAILKVLTKDPIRFNDLLKKVEAEVKNFEGSVGWYTVSTLRQLEREGRVIRNKGKIVTYSSVH